MTQYRVTTGTTALVQRLRDALEAAMGDLVEPRATWGLGAVHAASTAIAAADQWLAEQPDWRDWMIGMCVSVDVSTGDADEGHRYFGTITEVMDDPGEKHGVSLLVQDAEPNFDLTAAQQPLTDAQIIEIRQQTRFGKIGPWADTLAIARAIQRACADAWGVTLREPK